MTFSRRRLYIAIPALLALVAAACGSPASTPAPQTRSLSAATTVTPSSPDAAFGTSKAIAALDPSLLSALPGAPDRDLIALTQRLVLKSGEAIPRVVNPQPVSYEVGDRRTFWVTDLVRREPSSTSATLQYVSDRAYWYVEDGVNLRLRDIQRAAEVFDRRIYPTVTGLFGTEWLPGVDNDPRLTILHARLRGAAGYYSSADEYSTLVNPFSNEREIIYINVAAYQVGSDAYLGVLAHELQHAIHWNADPSEETWLNEGLSEMAQGLAGFSSPLTPSFTLSPKISLVHWPLRPQAAAPHYGAANLFLTYLTDHYGGVERVQRLVELPQDGIEAVDAYLEELGYADRFPQVFARWVVANFLNAESGPYGYRSADVRVGLTRRMKRAGSLDATVPQFAAEYVGLEMSGDVVVSFQGERTIPLLPVAPHSGAACWWGNRGDAIDTTLTREVDLTRLEEAILSFWIWRRTEEDWDYAYVEVSTDGGRTWDILEGPDTSQANPVGNSFGPGYTGDSEGWVHERLDISRYAGQPVLLRFEYVTDDAINGDGVCIDDVAIPEAGIFDDAESDGPWVAEGFVRTRNTVPQQYVVQVIEEGKESLVRSLILDAGNGGDLTVRGLGRRLERAVVVVAALAGGTSQPAPYTLTVRPTS